MMTLRLWLASAWATTYTPTADLEALAAASDAAVYGEVVSLRATRVKGEIWTVASVRAPGGTVVPVRLVGGCLEGVCMTVPGAPKLDVGERVFIFLRNGQPTTFSDGVFHVRGDEAWVDLAAVSVRDGHTPAVQAPLASLLVLAEGLLPGPNP